MQARRRRLAVALAASAALAGLTGCEKPTPLVTLYSGNETVHDEALSFCFPGQDPAKAPGSEDACRYDTSSGRKLKVLSVRPGDEVTVDVSKDLADAGWFVALRGANDQANRLATQSEHVTSFQPDFSQSPTYVVEVQKLERPAEDAKPVGVWRFTIVPG
jgi:hypothetical protein